MSASRTALLLLGLLRVVLAGSSALAQSSSLLGLPQERQPLTLPGNSWVYIPVEPLKQIQLHDVITVIVQHASEVASEGEVDRRTQGNVDLRLRDWIEMDGFGIKLAPQEAGDPRARGSVDSQYRSNTEVETKDAMKFRIAATVVDIRPNGNLVLEAHRSIRNNDEVWEQSLTGIVRPADVLPNNTVLSENIAELSVYKRETGHVREGYRRGWVLRIMDKFKPF